MSMRTFGFFFLLFFFFFKSSNFFGKNIFFFFFFFFFCFRIILHLLTSVLVKSLYMFLSIQKYNCTLVSNFLLLSNLDKGTHALTFDSRSSQVDDITQ